MKVFILDTGYILWGPNILTLNKKDKIIVPNAVLYEMESKSRQNSLFKETANLIRESAKKGFICIEEPTETLDINLSSMSFADIQILSIAKQYSSNSEVYILTADREIRRLAATFNLNVMDRTEFVKYIEDNEKNKALQQKANKIARKQNIFNFISLLISLVSVILSVVGSNKFKFIVDTLNVWGTCLLIFILAISLYALRGRFLLSYALFEFFFGFVTSVRVFYPDFDFHLLNNNWYLQILAGFYIMVRGLDNLGKSLKDTRYAFIWERYSGVQF